MAAQMRCTSVLVYIFLYLATRASANDLVRVNPEPDQDSPTISGQLEAREASTATWRKVCHASRTMAVTDRIAIAACRSLRYNKVVRVQVGSYGPPGRYWIQFSNCPPDPHSLLACTRQTFEGTGDSCRTRMVWITCEDKIETAKDPSEVQCNEFRIVHPGESLFFLPVSGCRANLQSADPSALLIIRAALWPGLQEPSSGPCTSERPVLRIGEYSISSGTETIVSISNATMCRANSVRARGSNTRLELQYYDRPDAANKPNITITAQHRLRCTTTEMQVALLKAAVNMTEEQADRVRVYGGSAAQHCTVQLNPDSDLIEWGTSFAKCGTRYDEEERAYENTLTIEKPTGNVESFSGTPIEYTEKLQYMLKCRGGDFPVHSGNITMAI
ncbi:uncharacterized protein LOC129581548 isoform X2 [Paramacrobiotus metropolitanus]|uniref:uncharacterized protein LOC129581548 isoform X2 n=1 Tax=Paramacrobiotus metropolitanus TaxID=2943436 RepID=UPI002445786F|nr:uncharacterized protein LOC129581548 isoform X2 [Paramacrobiotus metropolitanus]